VFTKRSEALMAVTILSNEMQTPPFPEACDLHIRDSGLCCRGRQQAPPETSAISDYVTFKVKRVFLEDGNRGFFRNVGKYLQDYSNINLALN
jgi:hypothetical protein